MRETTIRKERYDVSRPERPESMEDPDSAGGALNPQPDCCTCDLECPTTEQTVNFQGNVKSKEQVIKANYFYLTIPNILFPDKIPDYFG
jgi:hypothetical protein